MQSGFDFKEHLKDIVSPLLVIGDQFANAAKQSILCGKVVYSEVEKNCAIQEFLENKKQEIRVAQFTDKVLNENNSSYAHLTKEFQKCQSSTLESAEPKIFAPASYPNLWVVETQANTHLSKFDVVTFFAGMKFLRKIKEIKSEVLERDFLRLDDPANEFEKFIQMLRTAIEDLTLKAKESYVLGDTEKIDKMTKVIEDKLKFVRFHQQFSNTRSADYAHSAAATPKP
jgi:hypothetical protein